VRDPHGGVAGGEHEGREQTARLVVVRLGDRQGDDEQRAHRGDHRQPQQTFVGARLVAQPGVRRPAEPQQGQQDEPATEAAQRRVVGHQRGDLGQREDEDQVEEQLESRDAVRVVGRADDQPPGDLHARSLARVTRRCAQ
jgi:hypothetical protein